MNKKRAYIRILSFVIPVLIFVATAAIVGISPKREGLSVLCDDSNAQFVAFFSYFKSIVLGDNTITYSFGKTLGGEFLPFMAYYLVNPFYYLLLPFSLKSLPFGMFVIMALQIGCMGLAAGLFLEEDMGERWGVLIFSVSYALMGVVFAYLPLFIYLFTYVVTPLILLGLKRIVKSGRINVLYIVSLAVAIYSSYYLAYMICIFTVLVFIYEIVCETDIRQKGCFSLVRKKFAAYIASSAIACALAIPVLATVALNITKYKSLSGEALNGFHRNYRLITIIKQLLPGSFYGDMSNFALPYIYVGCITILFVFLYFINGKIAVKNRIASLIFMGFMIFCTYINVLDLAWHGFAKPEGFGHRYAFLISILLIYVGSKGFVGICEHAFLENHRAVVTVASVILAVVCICDLTLNTYLTLSRQKLVDNDEYMSYIDRMDPIFEQIKNQDKSLYRTEKDFKYSFNDAMLFDYKGLTHYSSCEDDSVRDFMSRMGFRSHDRIVGYGEGNTVFADSFLGVKYYISRFDSTSKGYTRFTNTDDTFVYRNEWALPLGFPVSKAIADIELDKESLFDNQNRIAGAFGYAGELYVPAKFETETVNLSVKDESGDGICYSKDNPEQDAYLNFKIKMQNEGNLYLYFSAPTDELQGARILINDFDSDDYFSDHRWNIKGVGYYGAGEEVDVKLLVTGDELNFKRAYFYEEALADINAWYKEAKSLGTSEIAELTSSELAGGVESNIDGYLLFTIPYDEHWNIMIDGKTEKAVKVCGRMMAVPISKGSHEVRMKYRIFR